MNVGAKECLARFSHLVGDGCERRIGASFIGGSASGWGPLLELGGRMS